MNVLSFKRCRGTAAKVALAMFLCSAGTTVVPAETFIKIGDIEGESQDIRHAGESEVLAWSWGMNKPGGATSGPVNVRALSFSKRADTATPKLMEACANGTHYNRAVLTIATTGRGSIEFYRFVCEDVLVATVQTAGSDGEDRPIETVSLNFARVGVEYVRITPTGGPGEKGRFTWNIAADREGGVTFPGDAVADADNDRLPDEWERLYGLDPARADADGDSDADGATNYEEFVAGTAPNSKDSVFKASFTVPTGAVTGRLTWSSLPHVQYRVLVSDRLEDSFQVLGTFWPTDERSTTISVPMSVGTMFFRVEVVPTQ
jgi:type VI secretion system secreted protein Hcp